MIQTTSSGVDELKLRQLLDNPALRWLVERLAQRLKQGQPLTGVLTLRDPSELQRNAVTRLFGRAPRGQALSIHLQALEQLLQSAQISPSLTVAVETLVGPLQAQRTARLDREQQWQQLLQHAAQQFESQPGGLTWLAQLQADGLLKRLSRGEPEEGQKLLRRVLALSEQLPASGLPLAELATRVAGDSHALDVGTPLGILGLRLVACRLGQVEWDEPLKRRALWADVGVMCDELSGPALVLNLRAWPQTLAGRAMDLHAEAGEPYRLSVRQLLREPPQFDRALTGPRVYVCENATVVGAAAHRLGARSLPLICTEGKPRSAIRLLLRLLSAAGISLHYHGDFDWDGLQIGNVLMTQHGAQPWRFGVEDYVQAAVGEGPALEGAVVEASWCPALSATMQRVGRVVHEEQVLEPLLAELVGGASGR